MARRLFAAVILLAAGLLLADQLRTVTENPTLIVLTDTATRIHTLPSSPRDGETYLYKNSGSATATISGGVKNIDGAASFSLPATEALTFVYSQPAGEWKIVAQKQSTSIPTVTLTATPTDTPTNTPTSTPSNTPSNTPTVTPTVTPTPT